jgi:hypothetical protein
MPGSVFFPISSLDQMSRRERENDIHGEFDSEEGQKEQGSLLRIPPSDKQTILRAANQ